MLKSHYVCIFEIKTACFHKLIIIYQKFITCPIKKTVFVDLSLIK